MAPVRRKQTPKVESPQHNTTKNQRSSSSSIRIYLRRALLSSGLILIFYFFAQSYLVNWQHTDSNNGIQNGRAYVVRSILGRGKGAFATRDIKQGELVIREKPFFIIPASISEDPIKLLNRHLNSLTQDQRNEYFDLSHHAHAGQNSNENDYLNQKTLSIFQTNAISTAGGEVGLFPKTARLNHGCVSSFNCVYTWREHEGVLVTHALKPIRVGEELTYAYFNTRQPRASRQSYLLSHYNFNCSCSTCSLPYHLSQASDKRIEMINALYTRLSTWQDGRGVDGKEAVKIAREIWALGEEEGYWSERGQLASDMAHVAAAHSDSLATEAWARLADEWFSYETGPDSPQVQSMREVVRNPKVHPSWDSREFMLVGGPDLTK